jgi:hypothetical protein
MLQTEDNCLIKSLQEYESQIIYLEGFIMQNLYDQIKAGLLIEESNSKIFPVSRFPYKNEFLNFTFEIYYPSLFGKWTALCNEIPGCVVQGSSKERTLQHLITAFAECVVLRKFVLHTKTLSTFIETPSIKIINQNLSSKYCIIDFLADLPDLGYNKSYKGIEYAIFINSKDYTKNITIPLHMNSDNYNYNVVTKYVIDAIISAQVY